MMHYNKGPLNDTRPPIVGRETEYTTEVEPKVLFQHADDLPALAGTIRTIHGFKDTQIWTGNGGRLYPDVNHVLEFAGPECLSGREVELHSRAGEYMIARLTELEAAANGPVGPRNSTPATKRSGYVKVWNNRKELLLKDMSTGHHENYYFPELAVHNGQAEKDYQNRQLASYLSTRGVWAGAGIVTDKGFRTTQKFEATRFIDKDTASIHGQKMPYRRHSSTGRLEIRTGDGNMSSSVAIDVIDFTSLVLEMIRHREFPDRLHVKDPSRAMRDSSLVRGMLQTNSGEMTAAEHQYRIAEAALEFAGNYNITPKNQVASAEHVLTICNNIKQYDGSIDTLESLGSDVEWAAKLLYIREAIGNSAVVTTQNLVAVKRDLQWESISPTKSPGRKWFANRNDPFTQAEIISAATTPPPTRAFARTALLYTADNIDSVSWEVVKTDCTDFFLPDPYDTAKVIERPSIARN